jgi:hypothetical protein
MNLPSRLRAAAAAAYVREVHGVPVAEQTLNEYRWIGGGLDFRKFGRTVVCDRHSYSIPSRGSALGPAARRRAVR